MESPDSEKNIAVQQVHTKNMAYRALEAVQKTMVVSGQTERLCLQTQAHARTAQFGLKTTKLFQDLQ